MANSAIQPVGSTSRTSPSSNSAACPIARNRRCASNVEAALEWYRFGLAVIPLIPGTKLPTTEWDPWLSDLSPKNIVDYWSHYPGHELGFIVGDNIIVLDADSSESIAALSAIEIAFNISPALVIQTTKGVHHYFKRVGGSYAKSDSHSTEKFPARLDVRTGRAMVVLPPSPGKEVVSCDVTHASELSEVGQNVIDAIFEHNGRAAPRPFEGGTSTLRGFTGNSRQIAVITALLDHIDADCGYGDWLAVGMAIHHATDGSDWGFALFDEWSSKGVKYRGPEETGSKWKSFRLDHPNPVTINTLKHMVGANGHDWMAVCSAAEDAFEAIDADSQGGL